jgi:hypothetical protein
MKQDFIGGKNGIRPADLKTPRFWMATKLPASGRLTPATRSAITVRHEKTKTPARRPRGQEEYSW